MENFEEKQLAINKSQEFPESEGCSRRDFIRKSAEVAAFSLFGVFAFDAVAEKVLKQVSEQKALGQLSNAAAAMLERHQLGYYAAAAIQPGCSDNQGVVSCSTYFNCDLNPYGCTAKYRTFQCIDKFTCNPQHNCSGGDGGTNQCEVSAFDSGHCHYNDHYNNGGEGT